jgi:5-hydroxyisourate hydrolase
MSAKSPITTHILDTARGRPAAGVPIHIDIQKDADFLPLAKGVTNADGRIPDLLAGKLEAGVYRMTFDTAAYFRASGSPGFYPYVQVVFEITQPGEHYHIPLLLSPYGYSTYRGS